MVGETEQDKPSNDEIRGALKRVVTSDVFGRSERARDLLTYLVEQDIAGRGNLLKGYSIAQDVFGRDEDFDPSTDSVVRVQVGRLRESLASYYAIESIQDPMEIKVPVGSYTPVYFFRDLSDDDDASSSSKKTESDEPGGKELDFGQGTARFEIDEPPAQSMNRSQTKRNSPPFVKGDTPVSPFIVSNIRRIWVVLVIVLLLLALIVYLVWDLGAA